MKRHLVLVGLPGSGKSTVGRRAAQLLDTAFSDLDEIVVSAAGMTVAEVFRVHGEARFRTMERAAMDGAMAAPPHVIAPGAGWIAQPSNLEAARDAVLVYLRIDPAAAAARLEGDTSRPLLAGALLVDRLRGLLAERETWYARAGHVIDASAPAERVAAELARLSVPSGKL
ncbi:MAG TPA: shikimate kinase [Gemmatimonadales bacterium]|nr:shikimate kinase [Gemmatimonadales bacterium]